MNIIRDLYIEENEKFDALVTIVRLLGYEYSFDGNNNWNYHYFAIPGKGYIELDIKRVEDRVEIDCEFRVGDRRSNFHKASGNRLGYFIDSILGEL